MSFASKHLLSRWKRLFYMPQNRRQTAHYAGINKEFFDAYYKNSNKAYALEVESVKRYAEPLEPTEYMADFTAPQSYRYIP